MKKHVEFNIGDTRFVFNSKDITKKTALKYAKCHYKKNPHITGVLTIEISEKNALNRVRQMTELNKAQEENRDR
jgi:3-hydroxymyristoyl/3-hydroxydecanoyl-(acyl carrier protein) dehydratase